MHLCLHAAASAARSLEKIRKVSWCVLLDKQCFCGAGIEAKTSARSQPLALGAGGSQIRRLVYVNVGLLQLACEELLVAHNLSLTG